VRSSLPEIACSAFKLTRLNRPVARRGAFWLLLVMFVLFVGVGSCLAINHENQIDCIKNYGHPC
jgi:hypothetical protein